MGESQRFHYGWLVLGIGMLAVFSALGLARFGYTTVLPTIQKELALPNEQMGWLATSNLVGYLVFSVLGGFLAGRYGARLVVTLGLLVTGIGMILTGLASNFWWLAVWRGVTGMGSGAANIGVMGLWAAWFGRRKRGLAAGVAVSGSSVALIATGLVVPLMLINFGHHNWRTVWHVFGGITLLTAILTVVFLRNRPAEFNMEPVGVEPGESQKMTGEPFRRRWQDIFHSKDVWWLSLVYIAFGFSYIIYMTFFMKRLITDGGYNLTTAGNLYMTMGGFSLFCGLIWGIFSDKYGRKKALVILYLLHSVAFGLFAIHHPLSYLFSAILFGLGAWSIPALMAAICGDMFGADLAPAVLGFVTLWFGLGQAAGPVVAGWMADRAGTFSPAFILAAAVALLGAVGALGIKENPIDTKKYIHSLTGGR